MKSAVVKRSIVIAGKREHANLSSAIRLFVLEYCRTLFGGQTAARDVSRDEAAVRPVNCSWGT